jgi:hypothetical protein
MLVRKITAIFLAVIIALLFSCYASAQIDNLQKKILQSSIMTKQDSLKNELNIKKNDDTLREKNADSISIKLDSNKLIKKSKSGIDSVVIYSAKDSVRFNAKTRIMRMRGEAKVKLRQQSLESEIIEMNFETSGIMSEGVRDSTKKVKGFPKFTDKGESFVGEKMNYNFKSKQGTITFSETEISNGYYFGEKIKRVSESDMFVKGGHYTTCDEPHPHYFFGSPEMEIVNNDKVFLDPIIIYVEDMPIFYLPIGLFFSSRGGRQSGLMIPSFFFSKDRGVVFQDFGIFLALSDYYDTQFKVDFFSKGGYTMKNITRWNWLDHFNGNLNVEYGYTRMNPDSNYIQNYKFDFNHDQALSPQTRITSRVSFMTQNYYNNTSMYLQDRIIQNIHSNAQYSTTFDNGSSFSISLNRDQNIQTNEWYQTFPQITYSLPQWKPLSSFVSSDSWLKDISVSYNVSGNYYIERVRHPDSTYVDSTNSYRPDTNYIYNTRSLISHNPSISISPKFGHFTLTPFISFKANNYFRRMTRTYSTVDSTTHDGFENGFYKEYSYSLGLSTQTRLYGILKPNLFGLKALRHTFQPTISYSYTPDLSNSKFGFYDSYYDPRQKQQVTYSRFADDGGGIASRYLMQSINYTLLNNFDAKFAQRDTQPDLNVNFFQWTISGSYNIAADSLKFSDINMGFRIPDIKFITMNSSANFTLYEQARAVNPFTGELTDNYIPINQFLISNGRGLLRLKTFTLSLGTSFSSEGVSMGINEVPKDTTQNKDTVGLGERFKRRLEYEESTFDSYGDNSPGFTPFRIPWNLSLDLSYSYNNTVLNQLNQSISLRSTFSFKLTPTWDFSGGTNYDFVVQKLIAPYLNLTKDLHCWELTFSWYPLQQTFYLGFNIKAQQLKDLKIEKRNAPIY